jgi:thiamine-phosphate pyrophosphorylase
MSGFPRLYAIVDRGTLDGRGLSVREFARELREAGVRLVQYRDKVNAPQEILRAANEIDEAFEGAEVTRIMNDRADLAVLAGWDGVHVGQGDLRVEAARKVLIDPRPSGSGVVETATHPAACTPTSKLVGDPAARRGWGTRSGGIVGISAHNEEQVRFALSASPDYVAVGPVFATVSKVNADPVVGLELVRKARAMTELPIVAIGGITLANARSVIEAGADAVALIGGLFVEGRTVREVARDFLEVLG